MPAPQLRDAIAHHRAGRRADAEDCCRRILAADPRHPGALLLLAQMACEQRRHAVAGKLLRLAIAEHPRAGSPDHRLECLNLLGAVLADAGSHLAAVDAFRRACTLRPDDPGVRRNLGKALWLAGELDDAVREYEAAIALLGGQLQKALQAGSPHRNTPMQTESLHHNYRDLISLHHARLDTRAAVAVRRELVAAFPDDLAARSELLVAMHYLPDISTRELFDAHVAWGEAWEIGKSGAGAPRTRDRETPAPQRRDATSKASADGTRSVPATLRIGYFSGDFREYPMSRFLAPVLDGHRRLRDAGTGDAAVTLYSDTASPDVVTRLLADRCDRFVDVSAMTDEQLDRRLREDELDLLVDLAGHMGGRRLQVLAGRPAARMASYINYPDTLGIAGWDYRITDGVCDPTGAEGGDGASGDSGDAADAERLHLEQLVRLEGCAWAYDPMFGLGGPPPEPGPLPALSAGHVTFGVLARPAKLMPEIIRLWADVLAAVPSSRLAVLQGAGIDSRRLLALLSNQGIEANRVDLLPAGDRRHYLGLHRRIDILLDTWPYNGMTGTCDALWMGVPVVTLCGDRHVARVGASVLRCVGLDECVATSGEAYVDCAARLAMDPVRLMDLRGRLRGMFDESPIREGKRIAARIEQLCRP